ncbi:Lymphocyte transmembrane adapter 1 [Trifolium repens]|nr:Lymphocyte transmembrane adapter 1 [Trifolium repens]
MRKTEAVDMVTTYLGMAHEDVEYEFAHMLTYRTASARQNAVEKPPFFLPSWTAVYVLNAFIVLWIFVVGFGFGGWASMINFIKQIDTFGIFAKCYQCPISPQSPPPHPHHQSRYYKNISTW